MYLYQSKKIQALLGTPEMPRNVQVLALVVTMIIKWHADKGDGMLPTFFIEYRKGFKQEWKVIPVKDKTSAVIDGLQADTVYTVRMFARTIVGNSNKTDEIIVKTGIYVFDYDETMHLTVEDSFTI